MNCAIKGSSSISKDSKINEKTPNPQKFVSEITRFEKENNDNSLRESSQIIHKKILDTNMIYTNNPSIFKNTAGNDKKIILKTYDKKLYDSIQQKTRKKEFISIETFETKFSNFRSCLEELKIDWREAHCNLNISRENMLEDTLKKIGSIDPYKVNYFI